MPTDLKKKNATRKTPKQERSRFLFDVILESTWLEVLENKIEKVSTTKIAKRAGVSIGSIYQYFPNKETLFVELLKVITYRTRKHFNDKLNSFTGENVPEEITDIVDSMVDKFLENSHHLKKLYKFISSFDQFDLFIASRNLVGMMISNYLSLKVGLPSKDAKITGYIIANSFVGVLHSHMLASKKTLSPEEIKDEFSALFTNHVLKKKEFYVNKKTTT